MVTYLGVTHYVVTTPEAVHLVLQTTAPRRDLEPLTLRRGEPGSDIDDVAPARAKNSTRSCPTG
jgi:FlaA1/EpsC-like NDP-sugar epimerase